MGGLEESTRRLLSQNIALDDAGGSMGSDLQTEGRIGLAIAELGDAELSRRCG